MNPFVAAMGLEPLLRRTGDTPLSLAGRMAGLGLAEQRAGIPSWGWAGVGFVAGATLVWVFGEDIKRFGGSLRR